MRCVRGVAAAAAVAAAGLIFGLDAAAQAGPAAAGPPHVMIFSGLDLWRHGAFAYDGLMWSPAGVDREGFTLKVFSGLGLYTYRSGALGDIPVQGRQLTASVLPGWRFVRGRFTVAVLAGLDVQDHRLSPDDTAASLRGRYTGLRTGFELWHEPTPGTMVAADGSVSTIGPSYSARAALGWRVLERFYLGPEAQAFAAGNNHRQVRAGVHLTGLRTGRFEWSAGLGFAGDTDARRGVYGKLGLVVRR